MAALSAVLYHQARRAREKQAQRQERGTFCLVEGCLSRTTEGKCGKHQNTVYVSSKQKRAAQLMVSRMEARGEDVPIAVRKIAEAQRRP